MDFRFAETPEQFQRFITEHPDQEAVFVKSCQNRDNRLFRDPKRQLLEQLAPILYLVLDFDGTCWPGIQWRLYENWILEQSEQYKMGWILRSLHTGLLQNTAWYGSRKNPPAPTHPRDFFTSTWDTSRQDAVESMWVAEPIMAMAAAGASRVTFENLTNNMEPRDGFRELMGLEFIIRRVIATLGIMETVENFVEMHVPEARLHDNVRICATPLKLNEFGHVIGIHPNVLVTSQKAVAVWLQLEDLDPKPHQILGIGDTRLDSKLVPDGALRVFLCAPDHDGQDHTKAFRQIEDVWPHFDVFLRSNSLKPIADLLTEAHAT